MVSDPDINEEANGSSIRGLMVSDPDSDEEALGSPTRGPNHQRL